MQTLGLLRGLRRYDQAPAERAQRRLENREFCRMHRVQYPANLLLVLAEPASKLALADAGLTPRVQHGQLCRALRSHDDRDQIAAMFARQRERQAALRIRKEREAQRLLGHGASLRLVVALGDRLWDIRESDHDPALVARLEPGVIHKGLHNRTSVLSLRSDFFENISA